MVFAEQQMVFAESHSGSVYGFASAGHASCSMPLSQDKDTRRRSAAPHIGSGCVSGLSAMLCAAATASMVAYGRAKSPTTLLKLVATAYPSYIYLGNMWSRSPIKEKYHGVGGPARRTGPLRRLDFADGAAP